MYVTITDHNQELIVSHWSAKQPDLVFIDISHQMRLQMSVDQAIALRDEIDSALDQRSKWLQGGPGPWADGLVTARLFDQVPFA